MKVDNSKLEMELARKCVTLSDLRGVMACPLKP